jgi:hypothetical protein
MNYNEVVSAMQDVDNFQKNLLLMFEDLRKIVWEKAYRETITDITNEGGSWIWDPSDSEHKRIWIFEHNKIIRFVAMLVTTSDKQLKGNSSIFKAMCSKLKRDPKNPLIMLYGVFSPRTIDTFKNDLNIIRHWVQNVLLMELHEDHGPIDIEAIEFGEILSLESKIGTNAWSCESARYTLSDLMALTDSEKLTAVAYKILSF